MGENKVIIISGIIVAMFVGGLCGFFMRGEVGRTSFAYGFEEQKQVWNRIRVDEHGYVICHKE